MPRYHFRKSWTALVCGACSASLRVPSASCNTGSLPWQLPVVIFSWQGESARIRLTSSMKSRGVGSITSTLLTTSIAHPSIAYLLDTISIIIYIHIIIIIAIYPLLAVNLASATVSTATSTAASTTVRTIYALLLGLLNIGLVTRIQEIWSVVLAATTVTWAFYLGHTMSMVRWDIPLVKKN